MELLLLGVLLLCSLGVIFFTRGVFSRDLTLALKRVAQQEQGLQEKADILEQRLGQLERDYQAKLRRAEAEAERIAQEAKQQAMNIRTVAIEEAKHRARQLLLEAEQGKVQLKSDLSRELNGRLVQRACESLRALLPPDQLAALHAVLMKQVLEALKQVDARSLGAPVERVDVVTAHPMGSAESLHLKQWAAASAGAGVPIQVEEDPALVAGCIVRAGQAVIDGSLANQLTQRNHQ